MPAYIAQTVYQQTLAPIQDKAVAQTSAGSQMSLNPTGSSSRSVLRPGSSSTTIPRPAPTAVNSGTPLGPSSFSPTRRIPATGGASTSASVSDMTDPSVPVSMPLYDPGEQAAAERGELPEYLARDAAGSSTPRTALAVGLGFVVGISAMWFWRR